MDIDIAPQDREKSHKIGQPRQSGEKQRQVIVKFDIIIITKHLETKKT